MMSGNKWIDCHLLDEEEGGRLTRFASVEQRGALAALEIRFGGFDRLGLFHLSVRAMKTGHADDLSHT